MGKNAWLSYVNTPPSPGTSVMSSGMGMLIPGLSRYHSSKYDLPCVVAVVGLPAYTGLPSAPRSAITMPLSLPSTLSKSGCVVKLKSRTIVSSTAPQPGPPPAPEPPVPVPVLVMKPSAPPVPLPAPAPVSVPYDAPAPDEDSSSPPGAHAVKRAIAARRGRQRFMLAVSSNGDATANDRRWPLFSRAGATMDRPRSMRDDPSGAAGA